MTAMGHNAWADRCTVQTRAARSACRCSLRAQPQPTGAPAAPAWRALSGARVRLLRCVRRSGYAASTLRRQESIDAAWLVETLLQGDARSRSERLDQFAFGQRALALTGPADSPMRSSCCGPFPAFAC